MNEPMSHRFRPDAAYARGAETRERIITAAIGLFGERGYEAASTREIARRAEVNAPVLRYYFDSKEGLYRACAGSLAEAFRAHFRQTQEHIQESLQKAPTQAQLMALLDNFLARTLEFLLVQGDASQRRLFLAQEQAGNGPGGSIDEQIRSVREEHSAAYIGLLTRLVGRPADDPLMRIRAMTLYGQISIFFFAQQPAMRALGWDRLDAARVDTIRRVVVEQAHILIEAWRRDLTR